MLLLKIQTSTALQLAAGFDNAKAKWLSLKLNLLSFDHQFAEREWIWETESLLILLQTNTGCQYDDHFSQTVWHFIDANFLKWRACVRKCDVNINKISAWYNFLCYIGLDKNFWENQIIHVLRSATRSLLKVQKNILQEHRSHCWWSTSRHPQKILAYFRYNF